jgi:hypothetical protein
MKHHFASCLLKQYLVASFVLFSILSNSSSAIFSQQTAPPKLNASQDGNKKKLPVEKTISLAGTIRPAIKGSVYECPFKLGPLEAGKVFLLNLEIQNPTETAIEYDNVALQCSCSNLTPSKGTIPAKGSASLMVRMVTAANPRAPNYAFSIRLSGGEIVRKNLLLTFDYESKNFLKIERAIQNVELTSTESLKEVKIPINFTSPVTIDNLTVKAVKQIKDVVFNPRTDGDQSYLEVLIHKDVLTNGALWGEYQVVDKVTGAVAKGVISAQTVKDISITPAVVRFRPMDTEEQDEESSLFVANLIFRQNKKDLSELAHLASAKPPSAGKKAKEDLPSSLRVTARIKEIDHALKVTISPIGQFGYRAKVVAKIPNELMEKLKGKSEIQWIFSSSALNSKHSTSAIFLKR